MPGASGRVVAEEDGDCALAMVAAVIPATVADFMKVRRSILLLLVLHDWMREWSDASDLMAFELANVR
jgi:hypothetical protein